MVRRLSLQFSKTCRYIVHAIQSVERIGLRHYLPTVTVGLQPASVKIRLEFADDFCHSSNPRVKKTRFLVFFCDSCRSRFHQKRQGRFTYQSCPHHGSHNRMPTLSAFSHCPLDPANQALHCYVDASLGRPPHHSWKRRAGSPCNNWLKQIRRDSDASPADLWQRAIKQGHRETLRPRLATRR